MSVRKPESPASHGTMGRRDVLRAGAVAAGAFVVPAVPFMAEAVSYSSAFFRHGVASGDPLPDRVVLWTRVTPSENATPGSGVGATVPVRWEVAEDPRFERIVSAGTRSTGPGVDHTVKVDAPGLTPGRWYYYRFSLRGVRSPVGRTRTAPATDASPGGLRFGVVSCSNYQAGHFAAYRHLAERGDLDAVLHLGDYLYEYGPKEYGAFRDHEPRHEMVSLADYRIRHAQYKRDPHLQAAHASCPWIITWDDHETANDSYRGGAENHQPETEGDWSARYSAAIQAYHEWMPIRFGSGETLYRKLRFGQLAELTVLDLRSYRSQQVGSDLAAADDPDRTMTGAAQLDFLRESLVNRDVTWKLIGNSVMFAPLIIPPLPQVVGKPLAEMTGLAPADGAPVNVDQWDGYQHDRKQVITHLIDNKVDNIVFLTGDIHSSWAFDVPGDAGTYPVSGTVATEFVVTSVTSDNIDEITGAPPRTASLAVEEGLIAANRHLKWVEVDSHGYSVLDVTAERVRMDWYFLADREDENSPSMHAKSFAVTAGTQQVREVDGPHGRR